MTGGSQGVAGDLENGEPGWVYFVRAKTVGLIKIGIAMMPERRLNALQVGSPDRLELVALIRSRDHRTLEQGLHGRFSRYRAHGEWFRPEQPLLKFIESEAVPAAVALACHKSSIYWRLQGVTDLMPKYQELVGKWCDGETLHEVARPSLPARFADAPKPTRKESATLRAYKVARGLA